MKPPPSRPASGAMPYIAISGSDAHEPVTPRRHAAHCPQLIWNGTIDPVADLDVADGVADRDDLGHPLVAHGVSGRHRQPSLGDRHIEVATRHRQRPDERLLGCRDLRVGSLPPGVFARRLEHQLVHRRTFL